MKIIAAEGATRVGKTTLLRKLSERFSLDNYSYVFIPEYVKYVGDQNKQPERPYRSEADMIAECKFYLAIENMRQNDIKNAIKRFSHCPKSVILLDRTIYTCLAYAIISDNPISTQIIQHSLNLGQFILPDVIIFLTIDYEDYVYKKRIQERAEKNPLCRGLTYKVKEYSYIYQSQSYENFFRNNVAKQFSNIFFADAVTTDLSDIYNNLLKYIEK